MKRRRKRQERVSMGDSLLLPRIRAIKADHPFWGYRRMWAYLKYREGLWVNKKRVYRIMRENNLTVTTNMKLKALRTPMKSKPTAEYPNHWWGIDMTKVIIGSWGWIYVVVVLDWYTKKVVGHYMGFQAKSCHWQEALEMAVARQFPDGSREHRVHLMNDNGCQPTSLSFMKACRTLEIEQAFTSYNNPKGNADTERFMRTFKEELVWSQDWQDPFEFAEQASQWFDVTYNHQYLHSALGYQSPSEFETKFQPVRRGEKLLCLEA